MDIRRFMHPNHAPSVRWPLGAPKNTCQIQEPTILELLSRYKCTYKHTEEGYDVVNAYGDAILLEFSAQLKDWEQACQELAKFREEKDNG